MRTRPLLGLCAAFAAGVLVAAGFWPALWLVAAVSVVLLAIGLRRGRSLVLWAGLLALTGWLGGAWFAFRQQVPADDVSRLPAATLTLVGTVDDAVGVDDDPHTDEPVAARLVLNVSSVRLDSDGRASSTDRISGLVSVRVNLLSRVTQQPLPPDKLPRSGDLIEVRGRLEPPDGPRNPGGFDYRTFLARRGIYSTLSVGQPERLRVLARASWRNPFTWLAFGLRERVLDACKRSLPHPSGSILAGILIGERHGIPQPVQEEFERTGTTHILATAGLHVGLVVCLMMFALRHSGVPRKPALIGAIFSLALFAVMAGERAAVLRAVIVVAVYLFGEVVEREPDLPNALALAALALLVANPNDLFDPGFQLSFATVVTIVLLMPLFEPALARIDRVLHGESAFRKLSRGLAKGLAVFALLAVAAQLGAAPFVACYFHNVSAVSIAANALAVPGVFLAIALGFPMAILFAIHPALAVPLAYLLRFVLGYIGGIVHLFSEAPLASYNVAPPSPLAIAGYYVCVWSIAWYLRSAPSKSKGQPISAMRIAIRRLALASGAVVLALGIWGFISPRPRELRVTFLDVGQGDACVLEGPTGKVVLVDTGGQLRDGEDDQGRRVVAPYLRYQGVNAIDAIVITHPHLDHFGGAASLLRRFPTHEVLDDGIDDALPANFDYVGPAARTGCKVLVGHRGQAFELDDGVTAEVLGPSARLAGLGANNASVVLRVTFGRTSFLLTGDAEAPEEAEIVGAGEDLSCDVLKVGHHGSKTSSTPEFLASAHPKVAVISVGKRNMYNHPSPEIVDRLAATGAVVYRTDRDGAVTCRSDGVSVRVEKTVR